MIKIVATLVLLIFFCFGLLLTYKSGQLIVLVWKQGVDHKSTFKKLNDLFTDSIGWIVLKDKNALYENGVSIGEVQSFLLNEVNTYKMVVFKEGLSTELAKIKIGDTVEYKDKKYKIKSFGPKTYSSVGASIINLKVEFLIERK